MPRKTSPPAPRGGRCGSRFNEAAARCRGKPQSHRRRQRRHRRGFNEAAARCRGKPHDEKLKMTDPDAASMRPRPDAAENQDVVDVQTLRLCRASMRPRPDAAENRRGLRDGPHPAQRLQ